MKVLAADILAKIPDLPADYLDHVHLSGFANAEVESWTDPLPGCEPDIWRTHIAKADDGLAVTCTCPARKLCKHLVAHYAVAKKDNPEVAALLPQSSEVPIASPPPAKGGKIAGLGKIAESQRLRAQADELLTDGIALIVRAESKEA